MSLIVWLLQVQWNSAVDHLTYEKKWSVERLSKLCLSVLNLIFLSVSLLHSMYWLVPLGLINLVEVVSTKGVFSNLLIKLGFQKEIEIAECLKATEEFFMRREVYQNIPSTENNASVFIFEAIEGQITVGSN